VSVTEIIGYVASALVVGTFTMKNMLWLRYVAVLSNVGFWPTDSSESCGLCSACT